MEVIVSTEDSLAHKIKADCADALSAYAYYGLIICLNNICTSNGLLDYIENTDSFTVCKGEIDDVVCSAIESFISDAKFTIRLYEEEFKHLVENKNYFADKIAFVYYYKIMAILAAKNRRKEVEKKEKELDAYHDNV